MSLGVTLVKKKFHQCLYVCVCVGGGGQPTILLKIFEKFYDMKNIFGPWRGDARNSVINLD